MGTKDFIIGIDLGTSNSAVAVVGDDGAPRILPDDLGRHVIPSVVSFHPTGKVLVGHEAKQRRIIDPKNTVFSVKRILGRRYSSPEVAAVDARSPFVIKEGENEQPVIATRAGEFAIAEISAIVLDHMRKIAEEALQGSVRRVVITVPANFNDAQRQATATAGAIAELVVVRILNEPTAAALAYGHGQNLHQTLAIYDFGGGTFDITILQLRDNVYEVLSTAGDTFLGGDDIDSRIVDYMAEAFLREHRMDLRTDEMAMQKLRAMAEQVKCDLSSQEHVAVTLEKLAIGSGGQPLDLGFSLERSAFVRRVSDLIERSFPVCDEALRLAGLGPTQVDEVLLVGGTTRIPYLRERVAAFFGRAPRMDVNPDEAVALGAALQGAALASLLDKRSPSPRHPSVAPPPPPPDATAPPPLPPAEAKRAIGRIAMKKVRKARAEAFHEINRAAKEDNEAERLSSLVHFQRPPEPEFLDVEPDPEPSSPPPPPRPVLLDVTPRALGIATVGGYCEEIIKRNCQVPLEQTRVFTTGHDDQKSVEIRVCQGESRRFEDNTQVGTLVLPDLPPRPRGLLRIAVTFEIDTDGILNVSARDEQTLQAQSARINLIGAQSSEEVEAARERLRQMRGG